MKGTVSRRRFLALSGSAAAGLAVGGALASCAPAAPPVAPAPAPTQQAAQAPVQAPTQAPAPAPTVAPQSSQAAEITLKLQDWQGGQANYDTAFGQIFDLYRQTHPNVKFERRALGWPDEYSSAVKPMLAGGELPDLVGLYQGPDLQAGIAAKLVMPLDDAFAADATWLPRISKSMKGFDDLQGPDGKYYAFPFDAITLAVAYYKDMLSKEGLKEWKTLDEFLAVANPLKAKGIPFWSAGSGDVAYWKESFNVSVQQQTNGDISLLRQAEHGKASWQNDIFLNAMKVIQGMTTKVVLPEITSIDYPTAVTMFYQKKFWGNWYVGEWLAGEFANKLADDVKNDNIGLAPFPVPNGKANANIWGGGPGQPYSISASSKHADAAVDFAKFLSTPEVCKLMAKNDIHPAGALDDAASYTQNKVLKMFLGIYNKADGVVPFSTSVGDVLDRFKTNIGMLMLGKMGPEEFLKDMDTAFYKA